MKYWESFADLAYVFHNQFVNIEYDLQFFRKSFILSGGDGSPQEWTSLRGEMGALSSPITTTETGWGIPSG